MGVTRRSHDRKRGVRESRREWWMSERERKKEDNSRG
jgi:hypothetical protein